MKALTFTFAAGLLSITAACQTSTPGEAYANPVDACASIDDEEDRARCIRNVVDDLASSTKREQERRR